jgi:hypothetical protein
MKLKELTFDNLTYTFKEINGGKIVNFTLGNEMLEFQSPKLLVKEVTETHLTFELLENKACEIFKNKITTLENIFEKKYQSLAKSIFTSNKFTVKNDKKITIFENETIINNLRFGQTVICLFVFNKFWVKDLTLNYNLNIKEIKIT